MAAAANSRLWVGRSQKDSHQRVVALIRRRDERWRCARTHTQKTLHYNGFSQKYMGGRNFVLQKTN